jgi:hypothetical protein
LVQPATVGSLARRAAASSLETLSPKPSTRHPAGNSQSARPGKAYHAQREPTTNHLQESLTHSRMAFASGLQSFMRNTRLGKVELYDERQNFIAHIEPWRAAQYLSHKIARVLRRADHATIKSVQLLPPAPPPSASATSPACITYSDVLANVGCPARLNSDWISPARITSVQDKIEEFRVSPSLLDRLLSLEVLPPAYVGNFD